MAVEPCVDLTEKTFGTRRWRFQPDNWPTEMIDKAVHMEIG
jgi:hypothetical protein